MKGLQFILPCIMALALLAGCDDQYVGQSSKKTGSLLALSGIHAGVPVSEEQGAKLSASVIHNAFSDSLLNKKVLSDDLFTGIISGSTVDLSALMEDLLTKGRILLHWEPGLTIYISPNVVSWYGVKFEFIFENYWARDLRAPLETCSGTLVTTVGTSGANFILTLDGRVTFINTTISVDPVIVSFKDIRLGYDILNGAISQTPGLVWDGAVEVDGRGITLDAVRLAVAALNASTEAL
jgi:hypothetical protein